MMNIERSPFSSPRILSIALLLVALSLLAGLAGWLRPGMAIEKVAGVPEYVGSQTCSGCHSQQFQAWQGSQHSRSMQHATVNTVLGDFADATVTYAGIESRFFRRDGRFFVRTDGPDGKLADFVVKLFTR
mgnify:FL=1